METHNTFYCPIQAKRIRRPFECDYGGTIYDCPYFRALQKMWEDKGGFRVGLVEVQNFKSIYDARPPLMDFIIVREWKTDRLSKKKINLRDLTCEEEIIPYTE